MGPRQRQRQRQRLHLPSHEACEALTANVSDNALLPHRRGGHREYASGSAIWYSVVRSFSLRVTEKFFSIGLSPRR